MDHDVSLVLLLLFPVMVCVSGGDADHVQRLLALAANRQGLSNELQEALQQLLTEPAPTAASVPAYYMRQFQLGSTKGWLNQRQRPRTSPARRRAPTLMLQPSGVQVPQAMALQPGSLAVQPASLPQPMAQVLEDPNGEGGSKRNIFYSKGWAPSGGASSGMTSGEENAGGKSQDPRNGYIFTSTHWGPMGKRTQLLSKRAQTSAEEVATQTPSTSNVSYREVPSKQQQIILPHPYFWLNRGKRAT